MPVTSITTALAILALIGLGVAVSARRSRVGIDIGLGDDADLLRRVRAHGNFTETVPIALIALAVAEFRGVPAVWLWTVAGLLIAGRALHAAGMYSGLTVSRAAGMLATYAALLVAAGTLVVL